MVILDFKGKWEILFIIGSSVFRLELVFCFIERRVDWIVWVVRNFCFSNL